MLELLRENNLEKFLEIYENKTLEEVLRDTVEFNNYRTFYKIDSMGNILKKRLNIPLVKLSFFGKDALGDYFSKGLFITEKRKIHKIDRLSSYNIEHLEKNLYKVFFNRDLSIAYRYAKEFILKDKALFIKKLSHFVLLDEIKNEKALITLAFIKVLETANKDNLDTLLYSYLPYIVSYPSNISTLEKGEIEEINLDKLDISGLSYFKLISYGYEEFKSAYLKSLSIYSKNLEFQEEESELTLMLKERAK